MTVKTYGTPNETYKTPLYNTAFHKFLKSGTNNLTPEELDEMNLNKTDLGYRYPDDWAGELFKNFDASSVLYSRMDHRQPGRTVLYNDFHVKLFSSKAALQDPTFDIVTEVSEAIIESVCRIIDDSVMSAINNISIKSMCVGDGNQFVESQYSNVFIDFDLIEMFKRITYRNDLKWYMNESTGGYISNLKFMSPPGGEGHVVKGIPPTVLFGMPVVYNEYMPTINSGNVPVVLADMKATYVFDIRDELYISRTDTTINDVKGGTQDGVLLDSTITMGGHTTNGGTYACLRIK